MKKLSIIFVCLAIIFSFAACTNNVTFTETENKTIANKIEKELVAYELPTNIKLIDSVSVAAKLTGNGNGMQYMGAILVDSGLSTEELNEYYSTEFDFIEVKVQETVNLDFIQNVSFNADIKSGDKTYYSIICWDDDRREMFGDFISELLDFDIRGH